jgi:hypothetical protein
MITIFTARIEDHVLMMLLPRLPLFPLLNRKDGTFYFFRAGSVHVYLRTAFYSAHPLAVIFPSSPPIGSQSISRDVPLAQARAFRTRSFPPGCLRTTCTLPEEQGIRRGLTGEGKLELTKAPRSRDRGCGNSRRLPPGEARADHSGRYVSVRRRHLSLFQL